MFLRSYNQRANDRDAPKFLLESGFQNRPSPAKVKVGAMKTMDDT